MMYYFIDFLFAHAFGLRTINQFWHAFLITVRHFHLKLKSCSIVLTFHLIVLLVLNSKRPISGRGYPLNMFHKTLFPVQVIYDKTLCKGVKVKCLSINLND